MKIKRIGNTNKRISKCHICKKKLVVYSKGHMAKGKKRTCTFSDSDDGVLFDYHHMSFWFCNDCWDKMIAHWKSKSQR